MRFDPASSMFTQQKADGMTVESFADMPDAGA
jgi:hypothetical protein